MASNETSALAASLLAEREQFKRFLTARLGNAADAEDVLQNGLVKALRHAGELRENEKLIPWFYQILRHALIDHVRSRQAAVAREESWGGQLPMEADDPEATRVLCGCYEKLLATMKPLQAELVRRVDLRGESVGAVAQALHLTPGNASVTLHRARGELRRRLIDFCGPCACLDHCECP